MPSNRKVKDLNIQIGSLPQGPRNQITDVKGVKVGHATLRDKDIQTGVTVILPCEDNIFLNKMEAGVYVLNGFGKSTGLNQIEELGTLESPIALTNTLNVGKVTDALVGYMLDTCAKDGHELLSVNTVICECNDSRLNLIGKRSVGEAQVLEAIQAADTNFLEGDVGAGRGMTCHQLKGGIGSASRLVEIENQTYTIGVFVLSNHGILKDLTVNGKPVGHDIKAARVKEEPDQGSIVTVIATDAPLSSRQLRRLCKRAGVGLARCGSYIGHGSGEVMLAFSTANRYDQRSAEAINNVQQLSEPHLDICFRAVAEATEESILNSMLAADGVEGRGGNYRESLWTYRNYL